MASLLLTIAIFAVITLVFTLPNSITPGPSLSRFTDHKIPLPKLKNLPSPSILNPFRPAAHAPEVQSNSTDGDSSWYSDWTWLSPFSSSFTLDENRSLLPPVTARPPIYTYYDHTIHREKDMKQAQNAVLLTWRRAWWAQGFRPIILGPAEAMANPLYRELQMKGLEGSILTELSTWLAWERMGNGLLCHYLNLPMGPRDDPLLVHLRHGEYPGLTRFEKLGNALFTGSKAEITAAVMKAMANPELKAATDFVSAVPAETFRIDPKHDALAFYDDKTIKKKYPKVEKDIVGNGAEGLKILNELIVSHLHSTWQNTFDQGISVVKPTPEHMTNVVSPAHKLATFLAECPSTPLASSCPPNKPKCKPCVAAPMKITTPSVYRNTSGLYTIGTVPHPYTMALLTSFKDEVNITWIRRESQRDVWISSLTASLMGTGISGAPRLVKFKEAVASELGRSRSLWIAAEDDMPEDLDWYFGFTIPRNVTDKGQSETPVPGPERRPKVKPDIRNGPVPSDDDLEREKELLENAKDFKKSKMTEKKQVVRSIEAWNLEDTEAWKFARAFLARNKIERQKWEDEEKKYAGGAGAERRKGEGWGRWFDD
jgi:hypothetical protein